MRRLSIYIADEALDRLLEIARRERRDPREQAALVLERSLVPDAGGPRPIAIRFGEGDGNHVA